MGSTIAPPSFQSKLFTYSEPRAVAVRFNPNSEAVLPFMDFQQKQPTEEGGRDRNAKGWTWNILFLEGTGVFRPIY